VADLGGRTSSEVVAEQAPGARLVKAFNTLPPPVLAADPRQAGGARVIFLSGDDGAAKTTVRALLQRLGFAAVDLGGLVSGGRLQQFPGGPLPALNLIKLP
jgi:predicted dinucleotide-binding enzyme